MRERESARSARKKPSQGPEVEAERPDFWAERLEQAAAVGWYPSEFWDCGISGLEAVFNGAAKRRKGDIEVLLFHAWHVAQWTALAGRGELKDWAVYRQQLSGEPDAPVAVDWQARKAQRAEQMKRLDKHKAKRQAPMRAKRG